MRLKPWAAKAAPLEAIGPLVAAERGYQRSGLDTRPMAWLVVEEVFHVRPEPWLQCVVTLPELMMELEQLPAADSNLEASPDRPEPAWQRETRAARQTRAKNRPTVSSIHSPGRGKQCRRYKTILQYITIQYPRCIGIDHTDPWEIGELPILLDRFETKEHHELAPTMFNERPPTYFIALNVHPGQSTHTN